MKEVTKIPEEKLEFFMKLIKELGLKVEKSSTLISKEEDDIPETHKNIVRERIAKSKKNPERLLDWEKAQKDLKLN